MVFLSISEVRVTTYLEIPKIPENPEKPQWMRNGVAKCQEKGMYQKSWKCQKQIILGAMIYFLTLALWVDQCCETLAVNCCNVTFTYLHVSSITACADPSQQSLFGTALAFIVMFCNAVPVQIFTPRCFHSLCENNASSL